MRSSRTGPSMIIAEPNVSWANMAPPELSVVMRCFSKPNAAQSQVMAAGRSRYRITGTTGAPLAWGAIGVALAVAVICVMAS